MKASRALVLAAVLVLFAGVACGDSSGDTDTDAAGGTPSSSSSPAPGGTPCDVPVDERPNGLIIEDVLCGSGPEAAPGDIIVVHYTGMFEDGEVFDTSKKPGGQPFPVQLGAGQVIPGWDIGLVGMQAGGTRKLTIPPKLAYGPNDYQDIPGGSTLIFEVELLQLEKAPS
jgi:FK506-binding nuclear protein